MPKIRSGGNRGRSHGIPFYKGLGQHILKNPAVIDHMIEKANVLPTDTVLEIGPGTGNMTIKLLRVAKKVIAVEKDRRMVVELHKRLANTGLEHKLKLIQDDFLKINLPFFNLCIANIPYSISSKIVFKLLDHRPRFRCAMIMFQKEFGQRLVSKPGDKLYCRLASNTQLLANVYFMMKISRNSYRPPPKVDSCVVRIEPKNPPPPIEFKEWDGLNRIIFTRKNKKIKSNFSGKRMLNLMCENYKTFCSMNQVKFKKNFSVIDMKEKVAQVLKKTGLGEERARSMTNLQVLKLLSEFNSNHIHFR